MDNINNSWTYHVSLPLLFFINCSKQYVLILTTEFGQMFYSNYLYVYLLTYIQIRVENHVICKALVILNTGVRQNCYEQGNIAARVVK